MYIITNRVKLALSFKASLQENFRTLPLELFSKPVTRGRKYITCLLNPGLPTVCLFPLFDSLIAV